jgi:hypothetical protein
MFRGFSQGGLEFHADIILPYHHRFQIMPMHGMFLLVQLESADEAVLGRITSLAAKGRLSSGAGEDFGIRAISEGRPVPEDLREQYLKYEVDIRVLGVIRTDSEGIVFAPSHRRLPHVGSKVAFLSPEVLQEIGFHNAYGAELGFLALGEFVFSGDDKRLEKQPWMQVQAIKVIPKFDVTSLVARRTFVFARAGFGKSNLMKLLFSDLYRKKPTVRKRAGREVPVGTLIFDPDREYYWPDDQERPGFCDVPELQDQLVVFTQKDAPSPFYGSFIAGKIKLDIRRLRPADVISIALDPERQRQQNVRKLANLNDADWRRLVDLVHAEKYGTRDEDIQDILKLKEEQGAELNAAKSNMVFITQLLHDPTSQVLDMLMAALQDGKLCVVDISQMRGSAGLTLSGIILRRIFEHNQLEFTKADPRTIPTIAVVEEAQSVLNSSGGSGEGPYIEWVKEGRKYQLGAVLITQQPGSIPDEILSQGDNWFIFHLLAASDLASAKRANAHFSDDLLSSLLNEPIEGNGIFWSSASRRPIPIPFRALSFQNIYKPLDPTYSTNAIQTYASKLKERFKGEVALFVKEAMTQKLGVVSDKIPIAPEPSMDTEPPDAPTGDESSGPDVLEVISRRAIVGLQSDEEVRRQFQGKGITWRGVIEALKRHLPDTAQDRDRLAHSLVMRAMTEVYGEQDRNWKIEQRTKRDGSGTTPWFVKL